MSNSVLDQLRKLPPHQHVHVHRMITYDGEAQWVLKTLERSWLQGAGHRRELPVGATVTCQDEALDDLSPVPGDRSST